MAERGPQGWCWPVTPGVSGIGPTLLRLHRHLAGDLWTVRWPHAPAWTESA